VVQRREKLSRYKERKMMGGEKRTREKKG